MTTAVLPVRERQPDWTECHCVMTDVTGRRVLCHGPTEGPDAPFCPGCEDRHPDYQAAGVEVSAR